MRQEAIYYRFKCKQNGEERSSDYRIIIYICHTYNSRDFTLSAKCLALRSIISMSACLLSSDILIVPVKEYNPLSFFSAFGSDTSMESAIISVIVHAEQIANSHTIFMCHPIIDVVILERASIVLLAHFYFASAEHTSMLFSGYRMLDSQ